MGLWLAREEMKNRTLIVACKNRTLIQIVLSDGPSGDRQSVSKDPEAL